MRIFIFKSGADRELRAFAGDPGGQQLPSKFGPWHAVGVIAADRAPPFKVAREVIEKAINSNGFQMFRMKSKKVSTA
jgi:hypothetical protein